MEKKSCEPTEKAKTSLSFTPAVKHRLKRVATLLEMDMGEVTEEALLLYFDVNKERIEAARRRESLDLAPSPPKKARAGVL